MVLAALGGARAAPPPHDHALRRATKPRTERLQDFTYLAAVTLAGGKVFALFVSSPTRKFAENEQALRHIVKTFKTL